MILKKHYSILPACRFRAAKVLLSISDIAVFTNNLNTNSEHHITNIIPNTFYMSYISTFQLQDISICNSSYSYSIQRNTCTPIKDFFFSVVRNLYSFTIVRAFKQIPTTNIDIVFLTLYFIVPLIAMFIWTEYCSIFLNYAWPFIAQTASSVIPLWSSFFPKTFYYIFMISTIFSFFFLFLIFLKKIIIFFIYVVFYKIVCSNSFFFNFYYLITNYEQFYNNYQVNTYLVFYLTFFISTLISSILVILTYLISEQKLNFEKVKGYECGFDPFSDAREPFAIKFFLVGILFIIFDIELLFLYPFIVSFEYTGLLGFYSIYLFLFVLSLLFMYEWVHKCLDW